LLSGDGWEELPDHVRTGLDDWCASHDGEIRLVRWLSGGLSGAPVGVIRWFEPGNEDRQLIVKFLPDGPEEARLTRRALKLSPKDFRHRHLVEPNNDAVPVGKWWMLHLRIAGGDLSMMKPLADLPQEADLAKICAVVIGSVLRDWNPTSKHASDPLTSCQYVRSHLGAKLAPQGALTLWAARNGLSPADDWVAGDGLGWLPNPLALAANRPFEGTDSTVWVQRGCAHGDLNARNVVLRPDRPDEFRLIDLGRFADDAPLARDPMHLLLAMASEWVKGFTPGSANRAALIRAIVAPADTDSAAVMGYAAVAGAIRNAAQEWADNRGWGDQWRLQALLSLVGCGLLFTGRHEIGDNRRWFFDLAAYATQAYLKLAAPVAGTGPPPPGARQEKAGRTAPAGFPRDRALIDRALEGQLVYWQRTIGNKKGLVEVVMRLLADDALFIRLAPCRLSGATPGSGVIALSDRHIHLADIDTSYRPSGVVAIAYGDLEDIVVHHDRRLGLLDTADIGLLASSGRFLARGLLRQQADAMVHDLEQMTGLRHRR
jgi:hypothetical protein